jgi:hypothetical protein
VTWETGFVPSGDEPLAVPDDAKAKLANNEELFVEETGCAVVRSGALAGSIMSPVAAGASSALLPEPGAVMDATKLYVPDAEPNPAACTK